MNAISLAYSNTQKQQQEKSWSDDPFDLKGLNVTGVTKISNHQRNLDDYIQQLVASYGEYCHDHYALSLDMITPEEQDELVRLYIESIDREIEWACYGEDQSMNSEFLCAMMQMLQCNDEESRENFAVITRKNVLIYYKETLEILLGKGGELYFQEEMDNYGYQAERDLEHGDYTWKR